MSGIKLIYDSTCVSTSDTTCNWTVPAGVCRVTFEIWGGGGGGGTKGTSCNCCDRGGSGSGGGYSKKTVNTVPGTTYSIVAGKAGTDGSYGSVVQRCCNGITGGTSYITGSGLTNFCAEGGLGGLSDFNTVCYSICGCNFNSRTPGNGFGGDTVAQGSYGIVGIGGGQNAYDIMIQAGGAGGPGGGAGGHNMSGGYCSGGGCAVATEWHMHGRVPGGGGAGSGCWYCCECNALASGRGAPGMVKITY